MSLAVLPQGHFGAILADPPWSFKVWSKDTGNGRSASAHYPTMEIGHIAALPVRELAAPDCVLFLWAVWPSLPDAIEVVRSWGFAYKTCAFSWMFAADYDSAKDVEGSFNEAYAAVRERVAAGGLGWEPKA